MAYATPALSLLQQALAVFASDGSNTTISGNMTASTAMPAPTAISPVLPTDLSALIALLFSFGALRDWLKLIVIGGFFETCRRWAIALYHSSVDAFFITASFEEDDDCYAWMMVWLAKQPAWTNARALQVSTRTFGLDTVRTAVPIAGQEDDTLNGSTMSCFPAVSTVYSMWYKYRWLTVRRVQAQTGYYGRREETLQISIMARSHDILHEILREARREYLHNQRDQISIYIADLSNNWKHVASRPKRSLDSIVLDPGIKDLLLGDARDFLASKRWYAERGIPFRRGYLLYGAPGSGKTSMIHSMAGTLGLDVYIISLSRVGLDDTSLNEIISDLPEKCIALMEDIDAAFHQGLTRDAPDASDLPPPNPLANGALAGSPTPPPAATARPPPSTSRITLSGLLNALDGVAAQEGRILFATTNRYSALDPALCRPGRMDLHIEFRLASQHQACELFRRFYRPVGQDSTVADADADAEKDEDDSGYNSVAGSEHSVEGADTPLIVGNVHQHAPPPLSRGAVDALAARFAEGIPPREFSMASLQGYLMGYKTRPAVAVAEVGAWVKRERAERREKQKTDKPVVGSVSRTPS